MPANVLPCVVLEHCWNNQMFALNACRRGYEKEAPLMEPRFTASLLPLWCFSTVCWFPSILRYRACFREARSTLCNFQGCRFDTLILSDMLPSAAGGLSWRKGSCPFSEYPHATVSCYASIYCVLVYTFRASVSTTDFVLLICCATFHREIESSFCTCYLAKFARPQKPVAPQWDVEI